MREPPSACDLYLEDVRASCLTQVQQQRGRAVPHVQMGRQSFARACFAP